MGGAVSERAVSDQLSAVSQKTKEAKPSPKPNEAVVPKSDNPPSG
jgi:hypothetical protein